MPKNNCMNCACRVGTDFCTKREDMKAAQHKKCCGWQEQLKVEIKESVVKYKEFMERRGKLATKGVLNDEEFASEFIRFCKKGGAYSFPDDRILFIGDKR